LPQLFNNRIIRTRSTLLGYVMATVLSAKQGLLKIADASAARAFIAHLAGATPAQRQAQLLTQLQLLDLSRNHLQVKAKPRRQSTRWDM
jgi:hypothetical protein